MTTRDTRPDDLLHGATLEMILMDPVEHYDWGEPGNTIKIRCFNHEPGINYSLKFLRKHPKDAGLYVRSPDSKD